jgi:hypothetical protein
MKNLSWGLRCVLRAEPSLYVNFQLFTELKASLPNVICTKYHDLERPMVSNRHFVSLSIITVMTTILFFFGHTRNFTEPCDDMLHFSGDFIMTLLDEPGSYTDTHVFWISCFGRCCGAGCSMLFRAVCGACGCYSCVFCSDEVNLEKNVLPEDPLGARCALLCSSARYDAGWSLSPSSKVQFQQLGVDSGHSLCSRPPPHHKRLGDCLLLAHIWPCFGSCSTP